MVRLIQTNGSGNVTANDDARVNFALLGTCIFSGIGTSFKISYSLALGGKYITTIGTGLACIGGRLIQVSQTETIESTIDSNSLYAVIDLRNSETETAYFSTAVVTGSKGPTPVDTDTFLEEGGFYAIQIYSHGLYTIPIKKPGESDSCRVISQNGKIGNTLISDLFDFDDDGVITDFKKVRHCSYADSAGGIKTVGGTVYPIGKGLQLENGGRLVTKITVHSGFTVPSTKGSSYASITEDSATKKIELTETISARLSSFDEYLFIAFDSKEKGKVSIDGINGTSFYLLDGLQALIQDTSSSSNTKTLYIRWDSNAKSQDLSDCSLSIIGTVK